MQLLYKTSSQLGRGIYVALLDQLCHSFEGVAKEAITWLLYAEDEVSNSSNSIRVRADSMQRKLNIAMTITHLCSGLVNTSLQD